MNAKSLWAVGLLIVVLALGAYGYTYYQPDSPSQTVSSGNQTIVETTVENFGTKLQMVSLLAPDAGTQIQTQYAAYVAPELLQTWVADPMSAPGRKTSSPWPDHIQLVSITPKASGNAFESYQVEGNVVEVVSASGGGTAPAAVYPVSLTVTKQGSGWVITSWSAGAYSELPQQVTITGVWECLPHKDTSGPQTMECALGIAKDQSDGHYAIDTSLMSAGPIDYATGSHVRITGVLTPANQLNSIQKYDIDGIIQATSIQKL